jgi:chromosome segregation ATPase
MPVAKRAKSPPGPAAFAGEFGPAAKHVVDLLSEVVGYQRNVIFSALSELKETVQSISERINSVMGTLAQLADLQRQLAVDTNQQSQDIANTQSALSMNVAAINQAISILKGNNPNLDLTVLQASIATLEANHQKMVDMANQATAAAAAAQTTMQGALQGAAPQTPIGDPNAPNQGAGNAIADNSGVGS